MNKKLVKSIIPLCIFILFITTSLQKANDRYNDTAVVEAMVNDEEKNNEENDKAENKKLAEKILKRVKNGGIMN